MVDIVVLNYNDADTTAGFVGHVRDFPSVSHIMIVDNASTDDSAERLSGLVDEKVRLTVSPVNGGYGSGNNLGIRELVRQFGSEYILLSNPDVIIENDAIEAAEGFLRSHKDYALAAPYMCGPDGTKSLYSAFRIVKAYQYALSLGVLYSKLADPGRYSGLDKAGEEYLQVDALAGSCFMMDAGAMIKYGMYDENMFLYCEEVALGIRMRNAGLRSAILPGVTFIHNHSVSINKTYKSEVKKRKMLIKSKLYVLKNYHKLGRAGMFFANCLAAVSIAETAIISLIRK